MTRTALKPLLFALSLALGAGAAFSLPVQADQEDKAVRVRDAASVGSIKFQVQTDKTAYRVDEPIRLKVRGERDFYLYVYAVDEASGNAWLILPNRKQTHNRISANQWQKVPGANLEFVSDKPGVEKLIIVASTKKVDIDPMKLSTKGGDFVETKVADLEDSFEAKGIRIRDSQSAQPEGVVVKRLEVKILGKGERVIGDAAAALTTVFVNTPKARYQEGERMHIVYGADAPGWVHLFVVEPDGTRSLLTRQQVKGNEQLKVGARAEAPYGQHKLVAVHSKTEEFDESALDRLGERRDAKDILDFLDKSIRLDAENSAEAVAVRSIIVFKY